MHASCVICIWYIVRSLDLTHLWCLGFDLNPVGDTIYEAPVAGDYGWGPDDQVIESEDRAPAPGV